MAQQHQINDSDIDYIEQAPWPERDEGPYLNGKGSRNRWHPHRWLASVMPVTEFDTIYALEGTLVNIATTNYSDRNGDYVTYYGVDCQSVSGEHQGPVMVNVQVDFMVKV